MSSGTGILSVTPWPCYQVTVTRCSWARCPCHGTPGFIQHNHATTTIARFAKPCVRARLPCGSSVCWRNETWRSMGLGPAQKQFRRGDTTVRWKPTAGGLGWQRKNTKLIMHWALRSSYKKSNRRPGTSAGGGFSGTAEVIPASGV